MPSPAPSALARRGCAGLALVVALLWGGQVAWAQDPTATTVPPTSGVLVPGTTVPPTSGVLVPGTTVAPTTTPPSTTSTTEAPAEDDEGGFLDLDANEKVWVIVAGLVGIAILMMVLTVIYWRHTKPEATKPPRQDRRIAKAERKEEKRRRKAEAKDPFSDGPDDALVLPDADDDITVAHHPDDGPMDLDGLLNEPDPSRSVFGSPEEDPDTGR